MNRYILLEEHNAARRRAGFLYSIMFLPLVLRLVCLYVSSCCFQALCVSQFDDSILHYIIELRKCLEWFAAFGVNSFRQREILSSFFFLVNEIFFFGRRNVRFWFGSLSFVCYVLIFCLLLQHILAALFFVS